MDVKQTLVIPAHVMFRQVGDETVILDLDKGTYFGLNPVGARVWQLLSDGHQVPAMIATLLEEFDVAQEQLQLDLDSLVSELISRGLVTVT